MGPRNPATYADKATATLMAYVILKWSPRSIPVMDDDFLSTYTYILCNIMSMIWASARIVLPGKPIVQEVLKNSFELHILTLFSIGVCDDNMPH